MSEISKVRIYLLRGMYLLISAGLLLTIWPEIIFPDQRIANEDSVIQALLGGLALLAALGIWYPLQMLPVLLFELVWKLIWVLGFALPVLLNTGLDTYAMETLFACAIGIILVPVTIPWRYLYTSYFKTHTISAGR
ncbi:hypothetical protein POV27_08755 [Aureisphaera galaxeae]|uniref:hypothetical protein n=1 Tax=Aureisphaera galaxeae TaxID=1538023 RepID=UPI0023501600|nr:hypothetical protein [Aureisphaera galaxeae]MDC8004140.1 hypothetical protein [Aureisphaera galaxeae]